MNSSLWRAIRHYQIIIMINLEVIALLCHFRSPMSIFNVQNLLDNSWYIRQILLDISQFITICCWDLIISAADYISWRCVSGPGPCIYPVAALILLYHLFMYSESRWFDICLGCSFLFSRTVRAHCSPQFFYRELRWAVLLISILKNSSSLTNSQIIL